MFVVLNLLEESNILFLHYDKELSAKGSDTERSQNSISDRFSSPKVGSSAYKIVFNMLNENNTKSMPCDSCIQLSGKLIAQSQRAEQLQQRIHALEQQAIDLRAEVRMHEHAKQEAYEFIIDGQCLAEEFIQYIKDNQDL